MGLRINWKFGLSIFGLAGPNCITRNNNVIYSSLLSECNVNTSWELSTLCVWAPNVREYLTNVSNSLYLNESAPVTQEPKVAGLLTLASWTRSLCKSWNDLSYKSPIRMQRWGRAKLKLTPHPGVKPITWNWDYRICSLWKPTFECQTSSDNGAFKLWHQQKCIKGQYDEMSLSRCEDKLQERSYLRFWLSVSDSNFQQWKESTDWGIQCLPQSSGFNTWIVTDIHKLCSFVSILCFVRKKITVAGRSSEGKLPARYHGSLVVSVANAVRKQLLHVAHLLHLRFFSPLHECVSAEDRKNSMLFPTFSATVDNHLCVSTRGTQPTTQWIHPAFLAFSSTVCVGFLCPRITSTPTQKVLSFSGISSQIAKLKTVWWTKTDQGCVSAMFSGSRVELKTSQNLFWNQRRNGNWTGTELLSCLLHSIRECKELFGQIRLP